MTHNDDVIRYGLLNEALSEVLGAALNNGSWPEQYEAFEVLPARDELPEYYRQIKKPMDLLTMRNKLAGHAYVTTMLPHPLRFFR